MSATRIAFYAANAAARDAYEAYCADQTGATYRAWRAAERTAERALGAFSAAGWPA